MYFSQLKLVSQCEPLQTEIKRLEARAVEVQSAVNQHKAKSQCLKEELVKLKETESSYADEHTQVLHDDVVTHLLTLFFVT